jgi:hypothetical protein
MKTATGGLACFAVRHSRAPGFRLLRTWLPGASALLWAALALAAEPGWFGLTLKIDAGGSWLKPVVESASVQSGAPG